METLGYSFYGHDNNSFMFENKNPFACTLCGSKIINTYNPEMKLVKSSFDVSTTFDGYTIVSYKFLDFLIQNGYKNMHFYPLVNHKEHFYFDVFSLSIIKFDSLKRVVQYTGTCSLCKYNPAYGSTPTYLKNTDLVYERGFYRTDVIFGESGKETPQKIIGVETFKELSLNKFTGIDCRAIRN